MLYYTVLLQTTITSHLLEMHEWARSGFGPGLFLLVVSIMQKKVLDSIWMWKIYNEIGKYNNIIKL